MSASIQHSARINSYTFTRDPALGRAKTVRGSNRRLVCRPDVNYDLRFDMSKQSPTDDSCHFDVPPVARANTVSMGGQEEHVLRSEPFVCCVMFNAMRKCSTGENGVGSFVVRFVRILGALKCTILRCVLLYERPVLEPSIVS